MLGALVARVPARLSLLRREAWRVLFLLRERFYMGLIGAAVRRLRNALAPSPHEGAGQEATLASAIMTHAAAVNRLADAVESLASASGAPPPDARTPPEGGVIAALAALHPAPVPSTLPPSPPPSAPSASSPSPPPSAPSLSPPSPPPSVPGVTPPSPPHLCWSEEHLGLV